MLDVSRFTLRWFIKFDMNNVITVLNPNRSMVFFEKGQCTNIQKIRIHHWFTSSPGSSDEIVLGLSTPMDVFVDWFDPLKRLVSYLFFVYDSWRKNMWEKNTKNHRIFTGIPKKNKPPVFFWSKQKTEANDGVGLCFPTFPLTGCSTWIDGSETGCTWKNSNVSFVGSAVPKADRWWFFTNPT